MSLKTYMILTLHKLYRNDKWINELFNSAGLELDKNSDYLDEVYGNNFFDTATESGLQAFETEAGIKTDTTIERLDREAFLTAKWIGIDKVGVELLQKLANEWRLGATRIEFNNGRWFTYAERTWGETKQKNTVYYTWKDVRNIAYIHVIFISPIGIPKDLKNLQAVLETYKPAHLPIYYTFLYQYWYQAQEKYPLWQDAYNAGEWDTLREVN